MMGSLLVCDSKGLWKTAQDWAKLQGMKKLTLVTFLFLVITHAMCEDATQAKSLTRMASAKSICESAQSTVLWNKNIKNFNAQPIFAAMHRAMRAASKDYIILQSCESADLVLKFTVDYSNLVEIEVTDADSGDRIFYESRSVSDIENDIVRLGRHFQSTHLNAKLFSSNSEAYTLGHRLGYPDDEIADALKENAAGALAFLRNESQKKSEVDTSSPR